MSTFQTIVAGTDFSPEADAAVRLAAALARADRARLVLAHAVDSVSPGPYLTDAALEAARDERVARVRREIALVSEKLAGTGVPLETVVTTGKPFVELIRLAVDFRAGLLVVGTRGLGGARRLLLGSTAERLVRKAPLPVLVAKEAPADYAIRRILVGIDFSECSSRALAVADALARTVGAEVIVAHAVDFGDLEEQMSRAPDERRRLRAAAETRLRDFLWTRYPQGAPAARVVESPADESLLALAEREGADLVALGSVGRSGVRALLIGNTAERVLRAAHRPVLVVKPADFDYPL